MKNILLISLVLVLFNKPLNDEPLKLKIRVIRSIKNNKILTKVVCNYINDSDSLYYLSNPICPVNLNFLPLHGKVRLKQGYYVSPNMDCLSTAITLQPRSNKEFILNEYLETMFRDVNSKDTTTLKIIYYGRIVSANLKAVNKTLESNQIIVNY